MNYFSLVIAVTTMTLFSVVRLQLIQCYVSFQYYGEDIIVGLRLVSWQVKND